MKGSRRIAVAVPALVLTMCLGAGTAAADPSSAGAASAKAAGHGVKPKLRLRILGTRQDTILEQGVRIRVDAGHVRKPTARHRSRPLRIRLRVRSATFDRESFTPLTKRRTLRIRRRQPLRPASAHGGRQDRDRLLRGADAPHQAQGRTTKLKTPDGACGPQPIDLSRAADCDSSARVGSLCMLPFPDDYYTVPDPTAATGRRFAFHAAGMPDNAAGTPIDPEPYLRNDGFSPGETILVRVPGLDNPAALAATDPVPINHIGRYAEEDSPVVVIDEATGERLPIWVEIDSNASQPESTLLEIHPARNYESGHRYVVALRNLRRSDGSVIPAPEGFRYYRDDLPPRRADRCQADHFGDFSSSAARGSGVRTSTSLGLHGRERREHRPPGDPHAQQRLRFARDRHGTKPSRSRPVLRCDRHRRPARSPDRATRHRHCHRSLLPRAELRPRGNLQARP